MATLEQWHEAIAAVPSMTLRAFTWSHEDGMPGHIVVDVPGSCWTVYFGRAGWAAYGERGFVSSGPTDVHFVDLAMALCEMARKLAKHPQPKGPSE